MNRYLHTLVLGLTFIGMGLGTATAQQLFRRSQFMTNSFLSNPAIAGTLPETPITMTFRNQWTGFEGAPETMTLSGHTALPNNVGVGAIVYSDDTGGAIKRTGVELAGSYTIDLNNYDAVSFGLSLLANQWSFDNDLDVWDVEDPALQYGLEQSLSIDAQFGMMVFGEGMPLVLPYRISYKVQRVWSRRLLFLEMQTTITVIFDSWDTIATKSIMTLGWSHPLWFVSPSVPQRNWMFTCAVGSLTWHGLPLDLEPMTQLLLALVGNTVLWDCPTHTTLQARQRVTSARTRMKLR